MIIFKSNAHVCINKLSWDKLKTWHSSAQLWHIHLCPLRSASLNKGSSLKCSPSNYSTSSLTDSAILESILADAFGTLKCLSYSPAVCRCAETPRLRNVLGSEWWFYSLMLLSVFTRTKVCSNIATTLGFKPKKIFQLVPSLTNTCADALFFLPRITNNFLNIMTNN